MEGRSGSDPPPVLAQVQINTRGGKEVVVILQRKICHSNDVLPYMVAFFGTERNLSYSINNIYSTHIMLHSTSK